MLILSFFFFPLNYEAFIFDIQMPNYNTELI